MGCVESTAGVWVLWDPGQVLPNHGLGGCRGLDAWRGPEQAGLTRALPSWGMGKLATPATSAKAPALEPRRAQFGDAVREITEKMMGNLGQGRTEHTRVSAMARSN